jgi:hypothetical protein
VLLDDLGRLVEDELGVALFFDPRAVNLNRWSMASRFLDCGGLLWAAYGSFASPAGVKGLLNVGAAAGRVGLGSRVAGAESCEIGPIEKAP